MNTGKKRVIDTNAIRRNVSKAESDSKSSLNGSSTNKSASTGENVETANVGGQANAKETNKKYYKIVGIIGAALLLLLIAWQVIGGVQAEQNYRSEAQSICADMVKANREMKQNLDWLGKNTRDHIAERLSDTRDVEDIKKKYTALKAPSSMEKMHKDLGRLIEKEVEMKTMLKDLCENPAEMNSNARLSAITELAKEIDVRCREIPLFTERETLSGIDHLVTRMVRHETKMRQNFVQEMNAILKSYDETLRLRNNVHMAMYSVNDASFKSGKYRDGILGEKRNREIEMTRVLALTVPNDAEEMVKHFETSLVHRIKCCTKMIQISDNKWHGYERDSAVREANDLLRAANTEYDLFQKSYEQYKKTVGRLTDWEKADY